MTRTWEFDTNTGSGSGSKKAEFVKFPEGVTRIRVLDDAPFIRWTHFMKAQKRSINCPGKGCPICEIRRQEKANKATHAINMVKKMSMNVLNRETNQIEILDQGTTFFEDLRTLMSDLRDEGKTLRDVDIKVRRKGLTPEATTYRLDIDKEYPLTDAELKMEEDKRDLEEYFKPHDPDKILRVLQGESFDEVFKSDKSSNEATATQNNDEEIEIQ